jgi:hypothetical protein
MYSPAGRFDGCAKDVRGLVAVARCRVHKYASAAAAAPPPRPCFLHPATPPAGSLTYRRNEGLNLCIARSTKGKGFRAHTWLADANDSGTRSLPPSSTRIHPPSSTRSLPPNGTRHRPASGPKPSSLYRRLIEGHSAVVVVGGQGASWCGGQGGGGAQVLLARLGRAANACARLACEDPSRGIAPTRHGASPTLIVVLSRLRTAGARVGP